MRDLFSRLRDHSWLTAGAVLILALIGWNVFGRGRETPPATVQVVRGDLVQEVSVTGKTKPTQELKLSFERSGKVGQVNARVGDRVSAGQVIVRLDTTELAAQLRQAEANILAQQARLDQIVGGTRPEEIEVKRTELAKAEQDRLNEYNNVRNALRDAYAKADDAVRQKLDDLFINDNQLNPQLSFATTQTQKKLDSEAGRAQMNSRLSDWQREIESLPSGMSPLALPALTKGREHLDAARNLLNNLMDAVLAAASLDDASATAYKTNITAARSSVNAADASLVVQEQAIATAELVVQRVKNELALKLAGSTAEEIAAQRAQVRQAEANAASIEAQISKMILRSPIAGVITRQDAKVGMIAGANAELVALISESGFEIETNLPEADVAKVSLGDPADVTLDAYGPDVRFPAQIASIEPAETVIEGVVTYKTVLQFDRPDPRVKSGMTANIDIRTDERRNVFILPQRAVLIDGRDRYVLVYRAGAEPERRKVAVGLRGSDGNIEIISGLSEGEEVIRNPETP